MDHAEERIALACAFRWAARYDLHESVANHFSVAVNDSGTRFLMNPRGRHFSLMRASELLLLDAEDESTMQRPDAPDPTAWGLHGAIHRRVPHARCLLHVHSRYATVLACLADPTLPPIDQNAMRFWGRVTVDDQFEGMGLDDEAERVAALAGDNPILLMRNHGVMVIGETVAQAFDDLYYFERSCETYITALQTRWRPGTQDRVRPGRRHDRPAVARLPRPERRPLPRTAGNPGPRRPLLSGLTEQPQSAAESEVVRRWYHVLS